MPTVAEFRSVMTAFANETAFPDSQISFWLSQAERQLPAKRWGSLLDLGVMLLTAHRLTLAAAAAKATDGTGGLDAAQGGVVSEAKAVGSVNKSLTRAGAAVAVDPAAGEYNATSYGQQFWGLVRSVGAGGLAV